MINLFLPLFSTIKQKFKKITKAVLMKRQKAPFRQTMHPINVDNHVKNLSLGKCQETQNVPVRQNDGHGSSYWINFL